MAAEADKVLPPGLRDPAQRTIHNPIENTSVYFAKYSHETDGAYTETHVTLQPGGGAPPHFHTTYRETFTGGPKGCSLLHNDKTKVLNDGESETVQAGEVHRPFNHLQEETVVIGKSESVTGKGSEGLEKMLYITYGLCRDGLAKEDGTPKSLVHTAILTGLGDTSLPGLKFKLATPILMALRYYGSWSGEEEQLIKKYWG